MYDIEKIREDFPILSRQVYGKPLVYLDNGATTQKPRCVVDATIDEYYNTNANVHRGVHFLSQQATELHEGSRETVRRFINARSTNEIVFTRGTTESINLLASSFGDAFMQEGDEVIVSVMEHHSNIVPWQLLAARRGIAIKVIPMNDRGELLMDEYRKLFSPRTRLVSVAHVSNVLGTVNPVQDIIAFAHEQGVPVLVDGAQGIPHLTVDVQRLDADFYVFSGHKVYGPTGVGVLYGKEEWLDRLPPYQGGGEMIQSVTFEKTVFNELPFKFEAGTPDYIGTTGLARALDYVSAIGMERIAAYEHDLTEYATRRLLEIPGMRIFGQAADKGSVISFLVGDIHHFDMGTLLDRLGIAVRTGHHCAQPLMQRLGIEGTVRASFGLYNTKEEIDVLVAGVKRVSKMFLTCILTLLLCFPWSVQAQSLSALQDSCYNFLEQNDTAAFNRTYTKILDAYERENDSVNYALRQELVAIRQQDQSIRLLYLDARHRGKTSLTARIHTLMCQMDSIHALQVRNIIDRYGWLSAGEVGEEANEALFLCIQHCNDTLLQQTYLPVLKKAVADGAAKGWQYAFLTDRCLMNQGQPQLYGTQTIQHEGKTYLVPLQDVEQVDELRASVGLEPLKEYLNEFDTMYSKEIYLKEEEIYKEVFHNWYKRTE